MPRKRGYRPEKKASANLDTLGKLLGAKANGTRGTVDSTNKLTLQDDIPAWEHQAKAGESHRHYGAFCLYRDMTPANRTLDAVAQIVDLSTARVRQLSAGNLWVSRAMAYDAEMHRLTQLRLIAAREQAIKTQLRVSDLALKKGLEALEKLKPDAIAPRDLVALLVAGAEIGRKALGMDSGQVSVAVTAGASSDKDGATAGVQVSVGVLRDEVAAGLDALAARLTPAQRAEALDAWMPTVVEGEVVEGVGS